MRGLVVVLVVVALVAVTRGPAAADTIALVSNDAALHAALVDAGDTVTVTIETAPGIGELAAASRAIADRSSAAVTVWLIPGTTTASLVTYDRGTDRVIVRELPYSPPLDAARATEAARIVRTMLRSMRAPDVEDPAKAVAVQVPTGTTPPAATVTTTAPVVREPQFSVGAGAGVWLAAPGSIANVAVTLTTAWRPHGLGAAVQATLAPAPEIAMSSFTGDVQDVVIAAVARNALELPGAGGVRLVPAAGVSLHLLHVAGNTVDSRRFDPAVRVGLAALRELPHELEVGLDVSADCLLQRQKYEAGNEEILAVPRVQIVASLVIGIRL